MVDIASIPKERKDKIAAILLDVRKRLETEGRLPASAPQMQEARAVPLRVVPTTPAPDPVGQAIVPPAPVAPAAETPAPTTVQEVPVPQEAAPQEVSADESALARKEVETGLHELLSGWDIFEKSGIFGMGGSGAEHPTYVKIRELPMEEVLAGSWKGADTDVVTNINQYVAGWQAEHGLTPDPQETFEHFLRRVIDTYLKAGAA